MTRKQAVGLMAIMGLLSVAAEDAARVWTSASGQTLKARLAEDRGATVVFRKENGDKLEVKRDYLSQADIAYLDGLKQRQHEAEATALEFKGLKLGMTREEVDKLVKESPWEYEQGMAMGPTGTKAYLIPGMAPDKSFGAIGDVEGKPLGWKRVGILYKDDVVYNIGICGPSSPIEKIDPDVNTWMNGALAWLTSRHGKPAFVHKDAGKPHHVNYIAATLRRLSSYEHARWQIGERIEIKLRASGQKLDNDYYGEIVFTDAAIKSGKPKRGP